MKISKYIGLGSLILLSFCLWCLPSSLPQKDINPENKTEEVTGFEKILYFDIKAEKYFDDSVSKAVSGYAVVRGVNAVVSVIQNTDIHLKPMGVGTNIAIGEILDPINDITERTADVFVTAITALGCLKIGHVLMVGFTTKLAAIIILLIGFTYVKETQYFSNYRNTLLKIFSLLLIMRGLLPIAAYVNEVVYVKCFQDDINKHLQGLNAFSTTDFFKTDFPSFPDNVMEAKDFATGTGFYIRDQGNVVLNKFKYFFKNIDNIVENLMYLGVLMLVQMIFQVLILPLLIFWLLKSLINKLFEKNIPFLISEQDLVKLVSKEK